MATKTGKKRLKEPVKVRTKRLADGSESYYLDIYVDGKRHYEFLKLYRLPEINAKVKEQNRATLAAVETIKSRRVIEITNGKAGLKNTTDRSRMLLSDWMNSFYEEQKRKGVRGVKLLGTVIRILSIFTGKDKIRMADIDKDFCLRFIDWMRNEYRTAWGDRLSQMSMANYAGYFRTALNAAVRAEVIPENPFKSLTPSERIKVPESRREFLTIDEIRTLAATECPNGLVKRAYLFSCHCGLRLSDVYALRWRDLSQDGGRWRASVIMQKTTTPIFLPLSWQAVGWLPERGAAGDEDRVFAGLPDETTINKHLVKWTAAAGIVKKITFHTARHTFATMMLTLGADLYTVSKLLGHSDVRTTQIYAKIVDSKKEEAVNLVDKVFD